VRGVRDRGKTQVVTVSSNACSGVIRLLPHIPTHANVHNMDAILCSSRPTSKETVDLGVSLGPTKVL
jgi:hypothetical protein